LKSLPQFERFNYLNSQTSLFYKNYIGIDRKCISRLLGSKTSSEIIQEFSELEITILSACSIAIIGLIISCIGLTIMFVLLGRHCCDADQEYLKVIYIIAFIFYSLPTFVISAILVSKTNAINYDLGILADPLCTDKITSAAVNFFSSKIFLGVSMAIVYLVFSILGIISNITVYFM